MVNARGTGAAANPAIALCLQSRPLPGRVAELGSLAGMTYFADLTPYQYGLPEPEPDVLNVGWLDVGYPFHRGETSSEFREALSRLVERPILLDRGFHVCNFCPRDRRDNNYPSRGNGQTRVLGRNGIWYAAPTMVRHYVVTHQYQPPPEFVDAVLNPVAVGQDDDAR